MQHVFFAKVAQCVVFTLFLVSHPRLLTPAYLPGAGFTKGLRLRLSQGLKSEFFVFAKSWT